MAIFAMLMIPCGAFAGQTAISKCGTEIKQPGSYVVTGNLAVDKSRPEDCIVVKTNYVTINLGGFTINCAGQPITGITDKTINFEGIVVSNGIITGCTYGIWLDSRAVFLDSVSTHANQHGIFLGNAGNSVIRSISDENAGAVTGVSDGIFLECPSNAIADTAVGNGALNLRTDQRGCSLLNNLVPPP